MKERRAPQHINLCECIMDSVWLGRVPVHDDHVARPSKVRNICSHPAGPRPGCGEPAHPTLNNLAGTDRLLLRDMSLFMVTNSDCYNSQVITVSLVCLGHSQRQRASCPQDPELLRQLMPHCLHPMSVYQSKNSNALRERRWEYQQSDSTK